MKYFAPISPLQHLELMTLGRGRTIMSLAQLIHSDPIYCAFIRGLHTQGYTIICDNGAAEDNQLSFDEIDDAAQRVNADVVVLPDTLLDCDSTLDKMERYKSFTKHHSFFMGVPQGKTEAEWMDCYKAMLRCSYIDIIGLSKISVPACFNTNEKGIKEARWVCVTMLSQLDLLKKPIHLLGMGDPVELSAYSIHPIIHGCDSCYPILAGSIGLDYTNPVMKFKRIATPHNYFYMQLSDLQYATAVRNIEATNANIGGA